MTNIIDKSNKLLMWKRVLKNLEKHRDKRYIPEIIGNVESTIERYEKESVK